MAVSGLMRTWKVRVAEAPAPKVPAVHTTAFWAASKVPAKGAWVVMLPGDEGGARGDRVGEGDTGLRQGAVVLDLEGVGEDVSGLGGSVVGDQLGQGDAGADDVRAAHRVVGAPSVGRR